MNNSIILANRFREVMLNGTWIAYTNYKKELENMDWATSITKVENFNTISSLAQHIHYYIQGIKNVFLGGELKIKDQYSFDFPEISSIEKWKEFLGQFWKDCEEFANLVEQMSDEKLESVFVNPKYSTYKRNIDGLIEHAYYHLGQIVLLKKIIRG